MRKMKPFAVVFIAGVAVVAFGLAGQQALSEGLDGAKRGECAASARSGCGMAKAAAAAKAEGCDKGTAAKTADLSTREGRLQAVLAEYAAANKSASTDAEGGCCAAKPAALAKAEGKACGAAVKAEGSACGAPVAATAGVSGVQAAIADLKSGKLDLASGKYGPAVTAAVVTALYAVAEEEASASGTSCELSAAKLAAARDEARKGLCPVAMEKHAKASETAAKAAVEAVKAIDNGSCPYAAVAAVLPASDGKGDCDGKKDCGEEKDCASCCDESGCEKKASDKKAGEARLNQQAKATSAE